MGLLGSGHANVVWRQRGDDVVVTVPELQDRELPYDGAVVFRLEKLTG